jgi:hypothetical protein
MAGKTTLLRPFIETSWVHDIDESGTPQYYGRLDLDSNWIIIRKNGDEIRFAGIANNTTYTGDQSGYASAWTNRASLTYGYISETI